MGASDRVVFNGEPGTTWRNTTGKVRYQMIVNWSNTCGVCAQYDHAIGPIWPLPYHRNCRCRQVAIPPEATAEPFVNFTAIVENLDDAGKRAVVGASNYRLIQAGVVKWADVVTPYRVRALHEVVALNKLDVDAMTAAGVRKDRAESAVATVNTPEHQLVADQRRKLVRALEGAGLDKATIAGLAADRLADRVRLADGDPGPGDATPPPPPATPPKPLAPGRGRLASTAVTYGHGVGGELKGMTATALKAIDAVHRVPDSMQVAVIRPDELQGPSLGVYRVGERQITARTDVAGTAAVLIHEFGHAVDDMVVSNLFWDGLERRALNADIRDVRAGVRPRDLPDTVDRLAKRLMDAVSATARVGELAAARKAAEADGGDAAYLAYLLKPSELWARSYTQWIVRESKDKAAMDEFVDSVGAGDRYLSNLWNQDDFAPVADAYRRLFGFLGLLR